jgi:S-adenosylmethionine/arginine decarboxylase-like enzyme
MREISQVQIWCGQHLNCCLESSYITCHSIRKSHLNLAADVTTCGKHCIVAHYIALVNEAMDSLKLKRVKASHRGKACVFDPFH